MKNIASLLIFLALLCSSNLLAQGKHEIKVSGTHFELNGEPFEYTGISFFNALYNKEFNQSSEKRREYIRIFNEYGINVLRVWCQWDNTRGFVDSDKNATLFYPDGTLKPDILSKLKALLKDADEEATVILLAIFSRESVNEGFRLSDEASDRALKLMTEELKPFRNLVFQIWNEFDYKTIDWMKIIKSIDPQRLVTNSPGFAGVLGDINENRNLDFLSPHTTRDDTRHWEVAADEIRYLITKYNKPVVNDEPARRGTPLYGGPKSPTFYTDNILNIYNVWKAGGYNVYHHDMFQTGYGTDAIPPNGIPLPGFSSYHDQVFQFLKNKNHYLKLIRKQ